MFALLYFLASVDLMLIFHDNLCVYGLALLVFFIENDLFIICVTVNNYFSLDFTGEHKT